MPRGLPCSPPALTQPLERARSDSAPCGPAQGRRGRQPSLPAALLHRHLLRFGGRAGRRWHFDPALILRCEARASFPRPDDLGSQRLPPFPRIPQAPPERSTARRPAKRRGPSKDPARTPPPPPCSSLPATETRGHSPPKSRLPIHFSMGVGVQGGLFALRES